jgi:small-conductance mechanosensitive channel
MLTHELNREIYKAFAAAGVVIPFPQRDIHMHSFPAKTPELLEAGGEPRTTTGG